MANENEFLGGIRFQPKRDNAPSYVVCRGWLDLAELIAWAQAKKQAGESKVNFDVKESREGGKLYGAVDNWKPNQGNGTPRSNTPTPTRRDPPPASNFDNEPFDDAIPFASNRGTF